MRIIENTLPHSDYREVRFARSWNIWVNIDKYGWKNMGGYHAVQTNNTWTLYRNSQPSLSCETSSLCCVESQNKQGDSKRWTQLNSKRCLNTRQMVGCGIPSSLLALQVDVGCAQNSLEFVSCFPLIHVVGRSFCLYTDSLFAQIGDSNDKCSSLLEDECWNKDETHAAQQSLTQF